ncbi:MAG: malonyl-CoA decarboxylase [Acidobacteriia bacterium]|nr:malonyl-CoA decarboxylase [Terriglobia bacterium]
MDLNALIGLGTRRRGNSIEEGPRSARQAISLCRALLSERGEISGVRLAAEALGAYEALDEPSKAAFFDLLAQEFSPDPEAVGKAGDAYRKDPSAGNLARLLTVSEPPRQALFRRLNLAPNGTRTLVEMRAGLLAKAAPQWAPIEADLAHLLNSWFNRGFLELHRIDWRTPAIILEKLIQYEAVHQIHGWPDLRRRLEKDRRCYAFFHPALPDDPIIFVEVALTRGMSTKVQPLVNPNTPVTDPRSANCAVFYSITNCHEGLRGVPFGNFLIKKVAEDLGKELQQIKVFATASPIPGFRNWLEQVVRDHKDRPRYAAIAHLLSRLDDPEWLREKECLEVSHHELPALCAYYLMEAKQGKEPVDSVARFHLRNGARLERINWLGDISPAGMRRSCGLLVNYVYRLSEVERNHEAYVKEYKIVASRKIESLARESLLGRRNHTDSRIPIAG